MSKVLYPNFGQYLKELREDMEIPQHKVAKALGYTTPQFVSNWERGLSRPPLNSFKKLRTIYPLMTLSETFKVLKKDCDLEIIRQLLPAFASSSLPTSASAKRKRPGRKSSKGRRKTRSNA